MDSSASTSLSTAMACLVDGDEGMLELIVNGAMYIRFLMNYYHRFLPDIIYPSISPLELSYFVPARSFIPAAKK